MKLHELIAAMEEIAPTRYAEEWDNVGLLAGDPAQEISKAMLTIDYTAEVMEEAKEAGCDVIIAYHPPLFNAIKRMTVESLIYDAIRRGVAIYSPHTALDVAEGGTNDMLADVLGLTEKMPLRVMTAKATQYKLVTFVPERDVEKVSGAMFDAGAGRIGEYSSCSFRSPGTGTFFGEEGTKPTVGQSGKMEYVPEVRVEMVMPIGRLEAVIKALRESHPYEEPAFDLVQLAAVPAARGMGRIGSLPPTERDELIERIKRGLDVKHLLVAGPTKGTVARAACCAGACGDLYNDAMAQKADLYLTGEMRHHDAIKAAEAGMTVVCALHSNSERAVLRNVGQRLQEALPGLAICLSQMDRDPFVIG